MEKGNLLPAKEARFAITMIVCFIWSTAKETLLKLKKEKVIRYVCYMVQQWNHCHVKHGKFGSFKTIILSLPNIMEIIHVNSKPKKSDINFDEVLKGAMRKDPSQLQKEYLNPWNCSKKLQMI